MMINPIDRELYLLHKLSEENYYEFIDYDYVLKKDVPDDIREADKEIREIRRKRIPAGMEW